MRDSEVVGSMRQTQKGKKSNKNGGFVIREVPIERIRKSGSSVNNNNNGGAGFCKGKSFCCTENNNVMTMVDYDTPELVVFLQEDLMEEEEEEKPMRAGKFSEFDESYDDDDEGTSSNVTNKCGFRSLMKMMKVVEGGSGDEEIGTTSHTFQERSGNGRRMEYNNGHERRNSESTSSVVNGNNINGEEEKEGVSSSSSSCSVIGKCGSVSHQSSESITSEPSFTFPVLAREWSGSPVRMGEPDRTSSSQSTRHRRRKMFFPCCCCKF